MRLSSPTFFYVIKVSWTFLGSKGSFWKVSKVAKQKNIFVFLYSRSRGSRESFLKRCGWVKRGGGILNFEKILLIWEDCMIVLNDWIITNFSPYLTNNIEFKCQTLFFFFWGGRIFANKNKRQGELQTNKGWELLH